jgi:hypothetical protein
LTSFKRHQLNVLQLVRFHQLHQGSFALHRPPSVQNVNYCTAYQVGSCRLLQSRSFVELPQLRRSRKLSHLCSAKVTQSS